jgi:hypothetical protein
MGWATRCGKHWAWLQQREQGAHNQQSRTINSHAAPHKHAMHGVDILRNWVTMRSSLGKPHGFKQPQARMHACQAACAHPRVHVRNEVAAGLDREYHELLVAQAGHVRPPARLEASRGAASS